MEYIITVTNIVHRKLTKSSSKLIPWWLFHHKINKPVTNHCNQSATNQQPTMVETETFALGIIELCKLIGQPGGIEFQYATDRFEELDGKTVILGKKDEPITYEDIKKLVKETLNPYYEGECLNFIPGFVIGKKKNYMYDC